MRESSARQFLPHVVSAVLTAMLLALAARALLWMPPPGSPAGVEERLQLRLVPRGPLPEAPPAPAPALPPAREDPAATGPAVAARPAAPEAPAGGRPALYDAEGRVVLPPGTVAAAPVPGNDGTARLDRPNPVDYRGTRFEDDWVSDGDAADVAAQAIGRGQRRIAQLLMGKDIQHAEARRPPGVAFNPARHERPSDLGSEATGDAWRAAPVASEPAPGLDGRASRSLREQVAALEREHGRCPRGRMEKLMEPVREALARLQSVEYAMAKGADPVRARHQLPSTADAAWDQGRRALWHARQQLQDCRG
ncbi:hypothetical protein [Pseudoxanthomonas suwonensis]|uniref:hypothetical protein n=1 Tax=Pseudoxanthomonas suwonensis TaxID=314722 RepID=UPI00138F86B1|nr:hypothetical protein [Pseudoxanthomonas suwonensis]KAF1701443.1 hypothetical protein CSC68_08845 [Pseudoxanthomonas suwonensis]